jgi:hypothetical protein
MDSATPTRAEQLASEYGREMAAKQRVLADWTIEHVARSIARAFAFMRDGFPFVSGEYLGEAHAYLDGLYYLDEYKAAFELVHAARTVLSYEAAEYRRVGDT